MRLSGVLVQYREGFWVMRNNHFACWEGCGTLSQALWLTSEESLPCTPQGRCWIWYRLRLSLPVSSQEMMGSYPSAAGNVHSFSRNWRVKLQTVQVIFSNLIYQRWTINKWAQNMAIFLLQVGLAFNWKDGLPQASDTVFLLETGLSGESGSLKLHRFDSRKVVSWITCLSLLRIHASFPRNRKWYLQSAITSESPAMLNVQLSDWQKLALVALVKQGHGGCPTTSCGRGLRCHTCTHFCNCWQKKMIMVLGIGRRSLSSPHLADGFSVSHQQGRYFPIGIKWVSVLVVWIATALGPV